MDDIHAGDLVRVVRDPFDLQCKHVMDMLNYHFIVKGRTFGTLRCDKCGIEWENVPIAEINEAGINALRISWIKKVPPLVDEVLKETDVPVDAIS